MTTMFPIGLRDDISVSTTSFSPGALLITLKIQQENRCLTSLEVLSWYLLQELFHLEIKRQLNTETTFSGKANKHFTKLNILYSIIVLYKGCQTINRN